MEKKKREKLLARQWLCGKRQYRFFKMKMLSIEGKLSF